jgi:hypothetical protein
MKNEIKNVSLFEAEKLQEKLQLNPKCFILKIDGNEIKNLQDYLQFMNKALDFPIPSKSIDGYNDWITDLSWLNYSEYAIFIFSYNSLMSEDLKHKAIIINHFKEDVLPWWEEDVKKHVVGGKSMPFNVYFVE